jgi:L-fuconate dehydratase
MRRRGPRARSRTGAIGWIRELTPFQPAWVEEPTAPENILGTAAIRRGVRPVKVATGEQVSNRAMFKRTPCGLI